MSELFHEVLKIVEETNEILKTVPEMVYQLFNEDGKKIDPTKYIKSAVDTNVPYETEHPLVNKDQLNKFFTKYRHHPLLYGFINKDGKVVYVGITQAAGLRGYDYSKGEGRLIDNAINSGSIKKWVIFKSNLPGTGRYMISRILQKLEFEFAVNVFKTYPANGSGALNYDLPGKNANRYVTELRDEAVKAALLRYEKVLTRSEYIEILERKFDKIRTGKGRFPYYKYLIDYIKKCYKDSRPIKDKSFIGTNILNNTHKDQRNDFYKLITSKSDLIEYVGNNKQAITDWENYRMANTLPITESLKKSLDDRFTWKFLF